MSTVFADTSGLYALLTRTDRFHPEATRIFDDLADRRTALLTTSYVLVETYALLTRRVGLPAVERFREDFAPLLDPVWIDGPLHERGLDLLLERGKTGLSLVDAVSFEVMRDRGIERAFAFDANFEDEGFELLR